MLNKSKGLRCGRQEFKVTVCGLKNGRWCWKELKSRFYQEMVRAWL
jgi:hypothetical protein